MGADPLANQAAKRITPSGAWWLRAFNWNAWSEDYCVAPAKGLHHPSAEMPNFSLRRVTGPTAARAAELQFVGRSQWANEGEATGHLLHQMTPSHISEFRPPCQAGRISMLFRDRFEAGRFLASKLRHFSQRADVVVLALPRGGVPVAFEVAKALNAPLDVFVVRKLGVPGHEELAMGAIASGDVRVLNENVIRSFGIPMESVEPVAAREQQELERREQEYREGRPPLDVRGRTVILVDDGLATGSSMRVAALALRKKNPAQVVVAVPVASAESCAAFESIVDAVVCAVTPEPFWAVGQWYTDFSQTSDEEVRELLRQAASFLSHQVA